jgi:hypothetical protein
MKIYRNFENPYNVPQNPVLIYGQNHLKQTFLIASLMNRLKSKVKIKYLDGYHFDLIFSILDGTN